MRGGILAALLGLICLAGAAPPAAVAVEKRGEPDERFYDIPAQQMPGALSQFATASHVSIAFEREALIELRSAGLKGRYTPQTGLQALLRGSGLTARFTGPASAVVLAAPRETGRLGEIPGRPPTLDLGADDVVAPLVLVDRSAPRNDLLYARTAQRELTRMLAADLGLRRVAYRASIAVFLGADGSIQRVTLLGPEGAGARGEALSRGLVGRTLSTPPPAGLPQPLRFRIDADLPAAAG